MPSTERQPSAKTLPEPAKTVQQKADSVDNEPENTVDAAKKAVSPKKTVAAKSDAPKKAAGTAARVTRSSRAGLQFPVGFSEPDRFETEFNLRLPF